MDRTLIERMQQFVSNISILSDEIANTDTMYLHRMEAQSIMRELEKAHAALPEQRFRA